MKTAEKIIESGDDKKMVIYCAWLAFKVIFILTSPLLMIQFILIFGSLFALSIDIPVPWLIILIPTYIQLGIVIIWMCLNVVKPAIDDKIVEKRRNNK